MVQLRRLAEIDREKLGRLGIRGLLLEMDNRLLTREITREAPGPVLCRAAAGWPPACR